MTMTMSLSRKLVCILFYDVRGSANTVSDSSASDSEVEAEVNSAVKEPVESSTADLEAQKRFFFRLLDDLTCLAQLFL